MGMSPSDIILKYVCPGAGGVIAFFMFLAPMPAVLEVRRRRYIGETNALPFAAMGANCLSWLFYGFLIRDWFVYIPNQAGLVFGWYYMFSCFKFSKDAAQDVMTGIILATVMLYWVVGILHQALNLGPEGAKTLWGSTAVGVLALYYAAPLATVFKVMRLRDSASLNGPLCTMNVINGSLWFAYGLAIHDYFIAMPNGIGAAFNVICVLLCLVFPKKRSPGDALRDLPAAAAADGAMLRLQSAHFTPRPAEPDGGAAPAPGGRKLGGFFDLTKMRWRTGGSMSAAAGAAAAASAGLGGTKGLASSANSLRWLLRSDTIAERDEDVEEQRQDGAKGAHDAADGHAAAKLQAAAAASDDGVPSSGGPRISTGGSEDAAVAVGSSRAPSGEEDGGVKK